jgi:hypothetical protein
MMTACLLHVSCHSVPATKTVNLCLTLKISAFIFLLVNEDVYTQNTVAPEKTLGDNIFSGVLWIFFFYL